MAVPARATLRTPTRGISAWARPEPRTMPIVSGMNPSPASTGERPRICCTYRVAKKKIANMPPATNSITLLAAASERVRKIDSRTSGSLVRCSIRTNAVSSATATASRPSVRPDVQP